MSVAQSWPWGSQSANKQTLYFISMFLLPFSTSKQISAIGIISRPISSHNHNATDKAIAMDRYQSYFRKLNNLFFGKPESAAKADQKVYPLLIYHFYIPAGIYLRKVNKRNTRTRCEICSEVNNKNIRTTPLASLLLSLLLTLNIFHPLF